MGDPTREEDTGGSTSPKRHRPRGKGKPLASLKLTALLIGLLVPVLIADAQSLWETVVPRALLLTALGANLLAVLLERWESFARKPPLLVFHLCMAAVVLSSAAGRMMHYESLMVLVEGQEQALLQGSHSLGPWAPSYLESMALGLVSIETRFHGRGLLQDSTAQLRFVDNSQRIPSLARPNHPAAYRGVRAYLTGMRGYAPVFTYRGPKVPEGQRGQVLLPEFKRFPDQQQEDLFVPALDHMLTLRLLGADPRKEGPWDFVVPAAMGVSVRDGKRQQSLTPGQSMEIGDGTLRLDEIRRWAAFSVVYNPWERLILFLAMVLGLSLAVFYLSSERHTKRRP